MMTFEQDHVVKDVTGKTEKEVVAQFNKYCKKYPEWNYDTTLKMAKKSGRCFGQIVRRNKPII
jgi:hypothetical protein